MKRNKIKDCEFLTIRIDPAKYAELKLVAQTLGTTAAGLSRIAIYEKLSMRHPQHQPYQHAA